MNESQSKIPDFALYGEGVKDFDSSIQPALDFRCWTDVSPQERKTALREIINSGWINRDSEIFSTIVTFPP